MEYAYARQRGPGNERNNARGYRERERDRYQDEGEREEDLGRSSQDRWGGRGPRYDTASSRYPAASTSRHVPLTRRPSFEQDRYARRGPPLPAGPPGSGRSSQSQSQSSTGGMAGASYSSSAYSRRSSPPYDARDNYRERYEERFQGSPSNGSGAHKASSMNGSPPSSDRTAHRNNGAYTNGRPRSASPPHSSYRARYAETSLDEDTDRRSVLARSRNDRDYRLGLDDRLSQPPRSREPSWSDNRRPYVNGSKPYSDDRSPPNSTRKRPGYDDAADDRRSHDNGWSTRAPRADGAGNGWRLDKGKGPATYIEEREPVATDRPYYGSDRPRSPDRLSNSTARSRGRRSPSPTATETDPPYRSPASNAGSSQSTSRNLDQRMEVPLSARIQREPPVYSAPPTPSRTMYSSPRQQVADSRIPLESPRSARAVSASQSPRFPSKPPWSGRRRVSESPPPHSRRPPDTTETESPRSLADRIGPPQNGSTGKGSEPQRSLTPPPRVLTKPQPESSSNSTTPSLPSSLQTSSTSMPASPQKSTTAISSLPPSASKSASTPLENSTLRSQAQGRKSPSPAPPIHEHLAAATQKDQQVSASKTALSPQMENSRPLPNTPSTPKASQSMSARPPFSASESRDGLPEPLRAPVPIRQISTTASTVGPPAETAETVETISMHVADVSQETVDMDLSVDMEEPRPSSPLSELPNSQAHIEDEVPIEPTAEEDDTEDDDFERTLQSVIEKEDSRDVEMEDLSEILEDNRFQIPATLPLPVQPYQEGVDPFAIDDMVTSNHDLLETYLLEGMEDRDKRRGIKIVRLRQRYKELDEEWQVHCHKLEKIMNRQKRRQQAAAPPLTPSIDSSGLPFIATPATPSTLAPSGRTNRRAGASTLGYGDAARSEAEFLEILARLEDADMADPNLRAMRTTAAIPDMVIDVGEREDLPVANFQDDNGLVLDPFEHYGINKHPDNWTEEEIAIFCRRYASHPKQFGKIASALPDKTIPQCVLFYYRSKKKIDFRALVDKRSRDGKRKKGKKNGEIAEEAPAAKKGPSLLGNLKRSRVEEEYEEDEDEPQTPGSAIARESAVLSTAKALTIQLHGATSENTTSLPYETDPFDNPAQIDTFSTSARQSVNGKKAARFLSPPPGPEADSIAPPSDGALAAAEALGVLASAIGGGPSVSRAPGFRQKKRKPSISEPMDDSSFGDDFTPKSATSNKRARAATSSYWSVADKNEFVRLLGVHGKNWPVISDGIESKTAVQCKNFFQNNTKKMGLMDVVAQAEEANPETRLSGVIVEELDMPSVYSQEELQTLQPATGYFASPRQSNGEKREDMPAGGGGMHLRNLLDDAPDAEGGAAHHPYDPLENGIAKREDEDSATEDEAEPARCAMHQAKTQQHKRISSGSHRYEPAKQAFYRHGEYLAESERRSPAYYEHPSYRNTRPSSDFNRDLASPAYPSVISADRGFIHSLPPPNGRFPSFPSARQWSPYESRTIYSQPTPSISAYFRNDREYGRDERGMSEDQQHQGRYSPPRTAYYRRGSLGEQDISKGLPQPVASYSHSQYYDSPQYVRPPSSSLRQSEDPDARPPYPPYPPYHLSRSR